MGKIKKSEVEPAAAKLSTKPNGIAKKTKPVAPAPVLPPPPVAALPPPPEPIVPAKKAAAAVKPKTELKPAKVTKALKPKSVQTFTADDINLRAYFIAEKRQAQGLPGDEHQDWVEAERQLRAEAAKPKRAKKTA